MIENPIHSCLHPKRIVNPYTKELLLVPCGECYSCLNKRSSRYKRLCELESMGSHSVTYFMTLTYTDEHVPLARITPIGDGRYHLVVEQCDSIDKGTILSVDPINISDKELDYVNHKTTFGNNLISFLCYRDIQLYIKRLRKYLSKYHASNFRYFAAGEYGPETYRAHWHIVLFFEKRLPASIKKDLFQLWRKSSEARFDFDLSKGGCVSYSAAYSNSSFVLPSLYKGFKISPFNRHSVKLGLETFKKQMLPEILETISNEQENEVSYASPIPGCSYRISCRQLCTSLSLPTDARMSVFPMDRTFRSDFIPSAYKFRCAKADFTLLRLFGLYAYTEKYFRYEKREYYSLIFLYGGYTVKNMCRYILENSDLVNFDEWFEFLGIDRTKLPLEDLYYNESFDRLYRFLLSSKKIFKTFTPKQLQKFIDYVDYTLLTEQLRSQEISSANGTPTDLYYPTTFKQKQYEETQLYKDYKQEHERIHRLKLEKKSFNDKILKLCQM